MAQKLIKVGARQIDVSGLSEAQIKKVVAASGNGGSLASRALAQQFQKGGSGKAGFSDGSKLLKTGGPNATIQDPKAQMKISGGGDSSAVASDAAQQAPSDGLHNNATWDPNVVNTANVQVPGTIGATTLSGNGQFRSAPDTLGNNKTGVGSAGQIDANRASNSLYNLERNDARLNFNMNNPGLQVDAFGNRQDIVTDPSSGETTLVQTAGGPLSGTLNAFQNAIGGYTSNFQNAVSNAQNANYNFLTRNLATDKARELENAKQELAQRGIPIDPSQNSLWSKSIESIDRKYQDLTNQANNQAIMAGNETLGAQVGAQNSILGSLTNTAQAFKQNATPYQGGSIDQSGTLADSIKTTSGADLSKYQIDKDYAAKMAQIKAQQAAAGGGGSSSNVVFNG